ncbi:hypothetical protein ACFW1J_15060 [Priestia aryabhattai]|uniref:hypothetical protein n=1 Tax=Priestia aryabhattai TaxID=412384 RepID=UPI001C8EE460|nr:hypothetical protein [Priestia aryabhattai]MBX9966131.1 hypothetical protein [Priestia aryabhattai]
MALSRNLKLVLLSLLIVIGFSSYFLYSNNNYKMLSKREINDFIEDKRKSNLSILKEESVKSRFNPHALILYKNDTKLGTYILTKSRKGIQEYKGVEVPIDKTLPIQVTGALSGVPYLGIYITNNKLIQEGKYVEMEFEDGTKVRKQISLDQKGYILSENTTPEVPRDSVQVSVIKGGQVLYTNEY